MQSICRRPRRSHMLMQANMHNHLKRVIMQSICRSPRRSDMLMQANMHNH